MNINISAIQLKTRISNLLFKQHWSETVRVKQAKWLLNVLKFRSYAILNCLSFWVYRVSGVRSSRFNRNLHKNQMRYFNSVNGKSKPIIWQFVMPIIKYIKRIVFEQCTLNERLCFYRSQAWYMKERHTQRYMTEVFGISYWPSLRGQYYDTKTPRSDIVACVSIFLLLHTPTTC